MTRDRDNIVKVVKKLDVQLRALLDTAAASAPGADGAADAAAERARLRNDQTALARHAFEETPNTEFYDGEEERRMSAWAAHDPLRPLPAAHGANRRTEAPKPKAVQSSGDIIGAMNALLANEKAKAAEVAPEEKAVCRGWTLAGAPGTQAVAGSASAADAPYGMEVAATAALFGKRLRQRAAERHIGGDAGGFGSLSQPSGATPRRSDGGGRAAGARRRRRRRVRRGSPVELVLSGAAARGGAAAAPARARAPAAADDDDDDDFAFAGTRCEQRTLRDVAAHRPTRMGRAPNPKQLAAIKARRVEELLARSAVPNHLYGVQRYNTSGKADRLQMHATEFERERAARRADEKRQKLAKREEKLEEKHRKQRAKAKAAEKAAAEKQAAHFEKTKSCANKASRFAAMGGEGEEGARAVKFGLARRASAARKAAGKKAKFTDRRSSSDEEGAAEEAAPAGVAQDTLHPMLQAAKVAKEAEALHAAGREVEQQKGAQLARSYAWRGGKAACGGVASIVAAAKAMAPASEPAPEAARFARVRARTMGMEMRELGAERNELRDALKSKRTDAHEKQRLRQKLAAAEQRQAAIVVAFTQSAALKQAALFDREVETLLMRHGALSPSQRRRGSAALTGKLSKGSKWKKVQQKQGVLTAVGKQQEAMASVIAAEKRLEAAPPRVASRSRFGWVAWVASLLLLVVGALGSAYLNVWARCGYDARQWDVCGDMASIWVRPDGTVQEGWAWAVGISLALQWLVLEPLVAWRHERQHRREEKRWADARRDAAAAARAARLERAARARALKVMRLGEEEVVRQEEVAAAAKKGTKRPPSPPKVTLTVEVGGSEEEEEVVMEEGSGGSVPVDRHDADEFVAVELPSASEVSSSPREYKSSPEYAHHASDDEYYRELRERLERDEESGYGSGYEEEGSAASESAIVSLSDVSRKSRDGEWELSSGRSRECSGSGRSGYGSREVSEGGSGAARARRGRRAAGAGAARGDGGGSGSEDGLLRVG